MKMHDKINLAGFAETLGDEDRDRIVGVMLRRRVELVLVGVALTAFRMRKGRADQVRQEQLALIGVSLRLSSSSSGGSRHQAAGEKKEQSFHALLNRVADRLPLQMES